MLGAPDAGGIWNSPTAATIPSVAMPPMKICWWRQQQAAWDTAGTPPAARRNPYWEVIVTASTGA
jgi:hypothetical protein